MKITDFRDLILVLPEQQQAFPIKRANWTRYFQDSAVLESCFGDSEEIEISREDIFAIPEDNLEEILIQTILWGYPAGMRGTHFSKLLRYKEQVIELLKEAQKGIGSWKSHASKAEQIPGLGLSTYSKLLFFIRARVEGHNAVILDQRIINSIQ